MKKSIEELVKLIHPEVSLRTPDESIIAEYVEAMKAGAEFPPVTIGVNAKKKDEVVLVDGVHRVKAALQAGLTSLAVVEKMYASPDVLLADMLNLNRHGNKVTPQDRDARIKLLAEKHGWKQEKLAKEFSMTQASISRILAGKQKGGTEKTKAKEKKEFTPMNGKQILTAFEKVRKSLKYKSSAADLMEQCWAAENATEAQKKKCGDNLDNIKAVLEVVKTFLNELDKK